MDPIEGFSGIRSAPGMPEASNASATRAIGPGATIAGPGWRAHTVASQRTETSEVAAGQVRPSPIGADGRFEKLILAVQALRLAYGPGGDDAQSTEQMRAAAEEIFSIDGVPLAFPSAAAPDAPSGGAVGETGTAAGTPANDLAGASGDVRPAPEPPPGSSEPPA